MAKKQPKTFKGTKKKSSAAPKRKALKRTRSTAAKTRKATRKVTPRRKKSTQKRSFPSMPSVKLGKPTVVTTVVGAVKAVQVDSFYPDFHDVDEILRFASYMYLLALTPVLATLLGQINLLNDPEYVVAQNPVLTHDTTLAAIGEEPQAVLGERLEQEPQEATVEEVEPERLVERPQLPEYPTWQKSFYTYENLTTPIEESVVEGESIELDVYDTASNAIPAGEPLVVVWETRFENDRDDLYTFHVATSSTARVYVDGVLAVEKDDREFPSSSDTRELSAGEHTFKLEFDASPEAPDIQFLFY